MVVKHTNSSAADGTVNKNYSWQTCLSALRPWSFTASSIPVALGATLCWCFEAKFSVFIFLASALTALCVHAAGNLVNTYFDFVRGVDTLQNESHDRTLVEGHMRPHEVEKLATSLYAAGFLGFLLTCALMPNVENSMLWLTLIFVLGMGSSFLYTGGLGFKYLALGELLIFVTFGPLTVLFAYVAQCGRLTWLPAYYAAPLAIGTVSILHANNVRDSSCDRAAGIVTLAILMRPAAAWLLMLVLLFVPYIIWALIGLHSAAQLGLPLLSIGWAFSAERTYRSNSLRELPVQLAQLNLISGALYIIGLLLTPRHQLPFYKN